MKSVMFLSSQVRYWAVPDGSPEEPCFLHKGPLSSLQGCSTFLEGHNDGSQTFIDFSGMLTSVTTVTVGLRRQQSRFSAGFGNLWEASTAMLPLGHLINLLNRLTSRLKSFSESCLLFIYL